LCVLLTLSVSHTHWTLSLSLHSCFCVCVCVCGHTQKFGQRSSSIRRSSSHYGKQFLVIDLSSPIFHPP
jgi:hypothetical protein